MSNRILPFAVVITLTISASPVFAQQSCESLTSLHLSGATVTSAATVVAAPAHCEVKLTIRPSKDSEIKSAVWLPMAGWNGKYQRVGNGGWAGSISYRAMADPLARGYATAATDDGHDGGVGATWAVGHPEKLIDFGYRAVHETSVQAKAVIRAFYGRDSSLNYFAGCSDGGREALMEAQRYPEDFNGSCRCSRERLVSSVHRLCLE
jgi:feruloyl esterase